MSSFSVSARCCGSFVIDDKGIRSIEPIELEDCDWDGKKMSLKGKSNVISFSNGNNSFITSFGNCNKFSSVSMGSVYINGVKIDSSSFNNNTNSNAKIFSRTWEELSLKNPTLSSLDISGSADFEVNISLDEDCDLCISGSGSITINGDNKNSSVMATVTGSGDISGDSKLKKLIAQVTGSGDIKDFKVEKTVKARVTGSGDIKVYSYAGCNVDKSVTGSGKVKVSGL